MTAIATELKAVLIDPINQTVVDVLVPNDFEAIKEQFIHCQLADAVDLGEGVTAWIDDEGLLADDWSQIGFTMIYGLANPLAGRIVILGTTKHGDMESLPDDLDAEAFRPMVFFPDHRAVEVPGVSITTFDSDGQASTEYVGPKVLTADSH